MVSVPVVQVLLSTRWHPSSDRCNRTERIRKEYKALSDRRQMRCICQDRYPASDQRRCNQGRLIRFHFPGSCQPDDQRSCLRQTDPWTRCFLRRSPALFIRVKGCTHPYLKLRRGACDHSFEFPSFCSDRFCTEL